MKKTLLVGAALSALLIAQSGYAADLGVRPAVQPIYKAPPAPTFSWTGCFVGGQLGWGFQRNNINQTMNHSSTTNFTSAVSGNTDSSGPVFGGQVGCDYQVGSGFVIGAQGTFLAADIDGNENDPTNGHPTPSGGTFSDGTIGVNSTSIFSLTGRLGFTGLLPQTMFYVRGGGAWMRTEYDLSNANLSYANPNAVYNVTHQGWTIGAGAEWMFLANWSAFAEFNYYQFDSKSITANFVNNGGFLNTFTSHPNVSTVTVGLNYRFGMH